MEHLEGPAFVKQVRLAAQFTRQRDQVIDVQQLIGEPGSAKALNPVRRLADYSDLSFFSFGPVYTACCVPFDILEEFRVTCKYEGPRVILRLEHDVIAGSGEWNRILEGVASEAMDELIKFAETQSIVTDRLDPQKRTYWRIKQHNVLVADPMAVTRNEYNEAEAKPILRLFTPSGTRVHLEPNILSTLPVKLNACRPDPEVVREASVVFAVTLKPS